MLINAVSNKVNKNEIEQIINQKAEISEVSDMFKALETRYEQEFTNLHDNVNRKANYEDFQYYRKELGFKLDKNEINTKSGVFPFQNEEKISTGYLLNDYVRIEERPLIGSTGFQISIDTSKRTIIYKRSFLTIIDALAYVGGLFSTLLVSFFFVAIYG